MTAEKERQDNDLIESGRDVSEKGLKERKVEAKEKQAEKPKGGDDGDDL